MNSQALEQLLALQKVDLALDDISSREESARTHLATAQEDLTRFKEQVKTEKRLLDDALKEHKAFDIDLKTRDDRVKKYSVQMYEVKTNKEYTALKDEIEKDKAEMAKIEDKILQLMLKEDELKGAAGRRGAELAEMEKKVKQEEADTTALLAKLAAERAELIAKRSGEGGKVKAQLLHRYDQIRKSRGGSPLAHVSGDATAAACSECHMSIRPQIIVEIHKQDDLVFCESCGRILFLDIPSPVA